MADQWSRPGSGKSDAPIGKQPSGAQDQGSAIDVTNYAQVDTGLAGKKDNISTEMVNPFGQTPTGAKTGGL